VIVAAGLQFNSFAFIGFFAAVAVIYYAVPHRFRWVLLLVASLYFYSTFQSRFVLLLLFATLVAYATGRGLGSIRAAWRKGLLALGIVTELSVLVAYKYADFSISILQAGFAGLGLDLIALPRLNLLLPVGLSFYTFSAISYMIDVERGTIAPERHLGRFALYVAFFPKLLAGPIERAGSFLKQLTRPVSFDAVLVAGGLQLMLLGLFKKVVIADRLAEFVDLGFANPALQSPVTVLVAVYFYAFQIYCDFSGYSDIAIGASAVLGIRLMENFRRPYFAASVPEFWGRRWHISLMQWFRDYLYIPLGGSHVARPRWYLNQMIVFLVSGLWHGANSTFVVWGALNGAYQVAYFMTAGIRGAASRRLPATLRGILSVLLTFHLILFAWIFFRAESLTKAWAVITRIFGAASEMPRLLMSYNWTSDFWLAFALIMVLLAIEACDEIRGFWQWLAARPVALRWAVYYTGLACLLVIGKWGGSAFTYMQF
jgi:D-alanyl-lipoteichoic acid acyltransferase DltB (MBOAT superfamily)